MEVEYMAGRPTSFIAAGDVLVLRLSACDPAGISDIVVQCFQFSMTNSNRLKLATGRARIAEKNFFDPTFEVKVPIPENAGLGKWGIQNIEFTNGRGYKISFYRGQGKFDEIVFEVIAPPSKEDRPLRLEAVEIAGYQQRA